MLERAGARNVVGNYDLGRSRNTVEIRALRIPKRAFGRAEWVGSRDASVVGFEACQQTCAIRLFPCLNTAAHCALSLARRAGEIAAARSA